MSRALANSSQEGSVWSSQLLMMSYNKPFALIVLIVALVDLIGGIFNHEDQSFGDKIGSWSKRRQMQRQLKRVEPERMCSRHVH